MKYSTPSLSQYAFSKLSFSITLRSFFFLDLGSGIWSLTENAISLPVLLVTNKSVVITMGSFVLGLRGCCIPNCSLSASVFVKSKSNCSRISMFSSSNRKMYHASCSDCDNRCTCLPVIQSIGVAVVPRLPNSPVRIQGLYSTPVPVPRFSRALALSVLYRIMNPPCT